MLHRVDVVQNLLRIRRLGVIVRLRAEEFVEVGLRALQRTGADRLLTNQRTNEQQWVGYGADGSVKAGNGRLRSGQGRPRWAGKVDFGRQRRWDEGLCLPRLVEASVVARDADESPSGRPHFCTPNLM